VLTLEGNEEIDEDVAFFNSRAENYNPELKPVGKPRPGKRKDLAAPASFTGSSSDPQTEQVPRPHGGSAKRVAR